jgi:hypothetical protein
MISARNQPDNLDAYMNLGSKDIVRLVLLLLVEEGLGRELAAFRAEDLPAQPVEGNENASSDCRAATATRLPPLKVPA